MMEFIKKSDLIGIIEGKLKELNEERTIIRQQQGGMEEKRPRLDNVAIQEAIWMRLKNEISDITTFHTKNYVILESD